MDAMGLLEDNMGIKRKYMQCAGSIRMDAMGLLEDDMGIKKSNACDMRRVYIWMQCTSWKMTWVSKGLMHVICGGYAYGCKGSPGRWHGYQKI